MSKVGDVAVGVGGLLFILAWIVGVILSIAIPVMAAIWLWNHI